VLHSLSRRASGRGTAYVSSAIAIFKLGECLTGSEVPFLSFGARFLACKPHNQYPLGWYSCLPTPSLTLMTTTFSTNPLIFAESGCESIVFDLLTPGLGLVLRLFCVLLFPPYDLRRLGREMRTIVNILSAERQRTATWKSVGCRRELKWYTWQGQIPGTASGAIGLACGMRGYFWETSNCKAVCPLLYYSATTCFESR
jgi:hypothetical protein